MTGRGSKRDGAVHRDTESELGRPPADDQEVRKMWI